ncbi:MAG: c-type cytochrome [Chloroflexota bacterium]
MNEKEKREYLENYKKEKEKGVPFFPNIIFKDTVVSLIVFVILALLATVVGAPLEERANPNDTNYTPRPEWYFLFLFQLLKYFPGKLEVVGAMILPGIFLTILLLLPFLDKSPKRHPFSRPIASLTAVAVVFGIGGLTYLAATEAPPPLEAAVVDQAAALYARNCANCHGASIDVPPGANLHDIIARGNHDGMPAWGGDLSADEIDLLVGFILSPKGSALFTRECGACHKNGVLSTGNPIQLQRVFDEGNDFPPHADQEIPDWKSTLTAEEQNALLNFLAAPDGERLFAINCAGCHGQGVGFAGNRDELRDLIVTGGHEIKMPGWKGTLSAEDLETLAAYVVDPKANPSGNALFAKHCVACHGDKVPTAPDKETALQVIALGGGHITMPVWGDILTAEQIESLIQYTWESSQGIGLSSGEKLFAANCRGCHGKYGEGGPNPSFPGDMIFPISSAEYLKTRDDATLRNIIAQGQPTYGMTPFGATFGGPLSDEQIDAIVAFIRSWETNPPSVSPPAAPAAVFQPAELTAQQLYDGMCAQCHGAHFEGTASGPPLDPAALRAKYTDDQLFVIINDGVLIVAMPGVGHMFTPEQVRALIILIAGADTGGPPAAGSGEVSFKEQVLPIFQARCSMCHNSTTAYGGWDASDYESVMTTGNRAPEIVPGDANASYLLTLLLETNGVLMPPTGRLSQQEIQIIVDWINAGALDN